MNYLMTVTNLEKMAQTVKKSALPAMQMKTFAETTSAHGFMYILANFGWLAKSIWILLTIAGIKSKNINVVEFKAVSETLNR
jgi:hypothetical protein